MNTGEFERFSRLRATFVSQNREDLSALLKMLEKHTSNKDEFLLAEIRALEFKLLRSAHQLDPGGNALPIIADILHDIERSVLLGGLK